jgi:3-deoxy-D-manno-octulosonic-acid transferase
MYNLGIWVYYLGIWVASFFNKKAKLWVAGREAILSKINAQVTDDQQIIWFHCASLGEFEQGRPLIEKIKNHFPKYKILLTFFSPSGYEIRKNYALADYIFYLPIDTSQNAQKFLEIVQPEIAFFVKYEFWFNYLQQLNQQRIPTYLISSVFRKDQIFFQSYGSFFKKMLFFFDHIFVQNEKSKSILLENRVSKVSIAGDTRVDRVLEIQKNKKSFGEISAFKGTAEMLIGGSTWPPDEDILIEWIHAQKDFRWKFIIAPHDISENHIIEIEKKLKVNSIRFSQANAFNSVAAKVLIIDNIGMLSSLYQYGKIVMIGGGFGGGIHNTLEPIAFGLPVIFGKKYQKFEEANRLVETGGGFSISNYHEFNHVMENLEQEDFYNNASTKAKKYILDGQGATEKIFNFIFQND